MISYLKGKLLQKDENLLILNVNNVGYQIYVSDVLANTLPAIGNEIELYIHHHIREDNQTLYGFNDLLERKLFLQLLSVSGIGPKTAIAFLSEYKPEQIILAIGKGDLSVIGSISGIGKKTAEKVILELKDKILKLFPDIKQTDGRGKVIETVRIEDGFKSEIQMALNSLGYSNKEIEQVIMKNSQKLLDVTTVEEGIRLVLQNLH